MSNHSSNLQALQISCETCPTIGYQRASLCVPVTVTPFAKAGTTTTFCCDSPIITPGTSKCCGVPNGCCSFTITQNICVAVPVEFGANAVVGELSVECGDVYSEAAYSALEPPCIS